MVDENDHEESARLEIIVQELSEAIVNFKEDLFNSGLYSREEIYDIRRLTDISGNDKSNRKPFHFDLKASSDKFKSLESLTKIRQLIDQLPEGMLSESLEE